jgi:class 3 adenylate cyclase
MGANLPVRQENELAVTRRLAAILVADVAGYSRFMEADEAGTFAALKEQRKSILQPVVKEHEGSSR